LSKAEVGVSDGDALSLDLLPLEAGRLDHDVEVVRRAAQEGERVNSPDTRAAWPPRSRPSPP